MVLSSFVYFSREEILLHLVVHAVNIPESQTRSHKQKKKRKKEKVAKFFSSKQKRLQQ